ncbi:MAG: 2,5-diamino-6-(ribosylamino)-4(3H)-pyrimidinone 5'-phosphate reductase [Thaumarchaeota archaeon]|nr:2,5-diamino-6-(ribosylamino)-4(3H)-pyrimidinone 5'-phosphate reductase [Nitrososphaerota archaeon]
MEESRPRIIINVAISVDGKIATRTGDSKFSSREDLVRVHKLRSEVDAVLIGKNTVLRDDPLLTVRHVKGRNPVRVILDSSGSIPRDSKILSTCGDIPTIIAVSKKISKERLEQLEKLSVDVIVAGEDMINPRVLVAALYKRGIRTVLIEGGGATNWSFVSAGLFDEMYITISPFVVGGIDATSMVQGEGFETVSESAKICLDSVTRLGDYLVLHYLQNTAKS